MTFALLSYFRHPNVIKIKLRSLIVEQVCNDVMKLQAVIVILQLEATQFSNRILESYDHIIECYM